MTNRSRTFLKFRIRQYLLHQWFFLLRKRKTAVRLVAVLGVVSLLEVGVLLLQPEKASAAWFDDSYGYRQLFTFTHNADIASDRRVTLTIDTATLITNGKMQADCDDSRFTDINGKVLRYQLTGTCNNAATTYDVVFPTIYNGTNTGYFYYGNPSAISTSDPGVPNVTSLSPSGGSPSVATEEKGSTPVLYWSFDEGYGTSANDSTQYANTGTFKGSGEPAIQATDMCVSSKCVKFDGSNDYVRKTYSSDTELDPTTGSFTVSAWFKHTATISGIDVLVSRMSAVAGVGYKLYYDATSGVCFGIDQTAGSFPNDSACTTTSYADSTWHHIEAVKNGATSITLYVDGKQVAQDASITSSSIGGSNDFSIGLDVDAASNPWDGFIDEVKVYNYAKSATQVQTDFANRGSLDQTSSSFGSSNPSSTLSNGLVGYWKMDESSWATTCSGTPVVDSSGNARNGNACPSGSAATVAAGKFGNAGSFDGTNDYVDLGNDSQLYTPTNNQWSMAAWINPTDFAENSTIMRKEGGGGGYFIRCAATSGSFQSLLANTTGFNQQSGGTCTAGVWQHLAMTYDGKVRKHFINGILVGTFTENATLSFETSNSVTFGAAYVNDTGENFKGLIDDARIYNRYLTDNEVSALYDWAPGPVGHWKFDEATGTNTNDSSGNSNTGTLSGATPPQWSTGKYGSDLSFNGSTSYVTVSSSNSLNITGDITLEAWVKPNAVNGTDQDILFKGTSTSNATRQYGLRLVSANQFQGFYSNGTTEYYVSDTTSPTAGLWYHVVLTRQGTTATIYVNGVSKAVDTGNSGSLNTTANDLAIGRFGGSNIEYFNGSIDDVRIYNYARTQQIIQDMNAGHPLVGTPVGSSVAHWSFDEGYGTNANDESPNSNTLTLSSASWTNSGKLGKAWKGTGSNWLSRADDNDFDFAGSDDFSVSLWFKSSSATNPGSNEYLIDKLANFGWGIFATQTDGYIRFGIDDTVPWAPPDTAGNNTDYYDGTWHHAVATKIGTSRIDLYIDGKLAGFDTSLTTTGTLENSGPFVVGDIDAIDNSSEFNGDIDEVKIYRYALSSDEVKIEYNLGKSQTLGALSTASDGITPDNSAARGYCPPGDTTASCAPVGEWLFDEGTGTSAKDMAGSNTGIITGALWRTGKVGNALYFGGSNSYYVEAGDVLDSSLANSSASFEAWVNLASFASDDNIIINKQAAYRLSIDQTTANVTLSMASGGGTGGTTTTTALSANQWYHIVGVHNESTDTQYIYINGKLDTTGTGKTSSIPDNGNILEFGRTSAFGGFGNTNGLVDNIRIYNYALSPAQVAWQYNRGRPVGYWQFDECQGTTAYDASGNGNNGTITPGASGNTAAGTCNSGTSTEMWDDGTTGKFNASLGFDGTNDYILSSNISSALQMRDDMSVSVWIKRSNLSNTDQTIVAKISNSADYDWWFAIDVAACNDKLVIYADAPASFSACSTGSVADTEWHHVAWIRNGATNTFYIDGKPAGTATLSSNQFNNWAPASGGGIWIGGHTTFGSEYFSGNIDDVRIYNYALTATQVKLLYNGDAAVRL
jgi:hypothetical protein